MTKANPVRSVSDPDSRSSITWAPKRDAPTPRPVYPATEATRPWCERSKKAQKREQVSMAPAQAWVNRTSSSWGKVSANKVASVRNVVRRCSSDGRSPLPKW